MTVKHKGEKDNIGPANRQTGRPGEKKNLRPRNKQRQSQSPNL